MSGKWGIPPKLDGGHASAFSVRRFSIHSSHAREDVGRYGVSDIKKLLKATQGDTPQLIDLISTNPHKIGSYQPNRANELGRVNPRQPGLSMGPKKRWSIVGTAE
jgi:hypothetical protein